MNKIRFDWDTETGTAHCFLTYKNKEFHGVAICHLDDEDMMNEHTGCYIAEMRANEKCLKHIRDNELIPELNAYKHLYSLISTSKKFNPNSYEVKMLNRKIRTTKLELEGCRETLKVVKESMRNYISEKEKFYKVLRNYRKDTK